MITVQESIQGYDVLARGHVFTYDYKDIILHINEYDADIVFKFIQAENIAEYGYESLDNTLTVRLKVLRDNWDCFSFSKPLLIGKTSSGSEVYLSCYGKLINILDGTMMFSYVLWLKQV